MTLVSKRREYITKMKAYQRRNSILVKIATTDKLVNYMSYLNELVRDCKVYIRRVDILLRNYFVEENFLQEDIDDLKIMDINYGQKVIEFESLTKKLGLSL